MVSLGSLILIPAVPGWSVPFTGGWLTPASVGFVTLWVAAALTVITGWDYLRVGLKHMD
jgi:CDP-diacylglycerol--glycerol-3-phosphate 3-phosphatidyltransferase/cardiolipin synthase